MSALSIRDDIGSEELRRRARRESDGRVSARLIAIANALEGMDRAIRASEYDQPSFRRPRLWPCPEELKTRACLQATNLLACIWQRRT